MFIITIHYHVSTITEPSMTSFIILFLLFAYLYKYIVSLPEANIKPQQYLMMKQIIGNKSFLYYFNFIYFSYITVISKNR